MRELILIFCLMPLIGHNQILPQTRFNTIIFIDGKIPINRQASVSFKFKNLDAKEESINCEYLLGELRVKEKEAIILEHLNEENSLRINIEHKKKIYSGVLLKNWLYGTYLVIRITNSKKNLNYHFGVSFPGGSTPFLKKEYNMFDDS